MDSAKFSERLDRLFRATNTDSDSSLAKVLGIKPQSVAAARKRAQIPGGWVETVSRKMNVSADWLFFGHGSMQRDDQQSKPKTTKEPWMCPRCAELLDEMFYTNEELRFLSEERRELTKENKELLRENKELLEKLAEARARAAPAEDTQRGAKRNVA